jgi:hypothetical protein
LYTALATAAAMPQMPSSATPFALVREEMGSTYRLEEQFKAWRVNVAITPALSHAFDPAFGSDKPAQRPG